MNTVIDTVEGHSMPPQDRAEKIPQRTHLGPAGTNSTAASDAVRHALDLLSRASADWRNGGGCESGALHWPVAVTLARAELRKALEALAVDQRPRAPTELYALDTDTDDARAGMAWYNRTTVTERRYWHQVARSAVPADAWEAYKAGGPTP